MYLSNVGVEGYRPLFEERAHANKCLNFSVNTEFLEDLVLVPLTGILHFYIFRI